MPHTSAATAGLRVSALTLILAVLCVQVRAGGPLTGADVPATRVYLGVHWFTDVVAGAILDAVFVTVGAATCERVHRPLVAPSKPLPAVDRVGG